MLFKKGIEFFKRFWDFEATRGLSQTHHAQKYQPKSPRASPLGLVCQLATLMATLSPRFLPSRCKPAFQFRPRLFQMTWKCKRNRLLSIADSKLRKNYCANIWIVHNPLLPCRQSRLQWKHQTIPYPAKSAAENL